LNLTKFLQKHGDPKNSIAFKLSGLQRKIFPEELASIYDQYGLSSFSNGFLWFVDPEKYRRDTIIWLGNSKKAIPFLRTAFGSFFYVDGDDIGYKSVVTGNGAYFANFDQVFNGFLCSDRTLNDVYFFDLYNLILEREGAVERDECYGFFPPVGLGGQISVDSAKRVKLHEHLAFLSQL
jgi:hypothetical protein